MVLRTFLDSAADRAWWQQQSVITFLCDTDYPFLFFQFLCGRLMLLGENVRMPDIYNVDQLPTIRASCECSFLGSKTYYWLKNLDLIDAKRRAYWVDYLMHYQGPNCLMFCIKQLPRDFSSHGEQIILKELTTPIEIQRLLLFLGIADEKVRFHVAAELCKRSKKISLDIVCVVARYLLVLPVGSDKLLPRLLDTLIMPEKSLFTMSGYLLAGNGTAFFRAWSAVIYDFPELFWVSYWSDVLWRAYFFAQLMQSGNAIGAKQLAHKLPFSFIQRDWRGVKLAKLKDAVSALYLIDRDLKNGVTGGYGALESALVRLVN